MALRGCVGHGALQRLPYVYTAFEIQEMKFWRAIPRENNRIVDPVKRAKNHTSRLINAQLAKLSSITRKSSLEFPALRHLHPFEREVVVLTLGDGKYERNVQLLRKVYAQLHNVGKQYEIECQTHRTKQEAIDTGLRCIEKLRTLVDTNADTLLEVAQMTKTLRGLPSVDLDKPIFAFVGAPNVGKSSLVRALSTASPEVANYPFTTRGITLGHIFVEGISYQIADTPGLLYRPSESRNAIEKLGLAMIEKTQAAVGFVFDPSGQSGTSIKDQLDLREELFERTTTSRTTQALAWVDIISKVDLSVPQIQELHHKLPDAFLVSTETNQGLIEVGQHIRHLLTHSHLKSQ